MNFIDTHAHLADFAADKTLPDVISQARSNNVSRIITCSTTPAEWILYCNLRKEYRDTVCWQIGIHPSEVKPELLDALDALATFFIDQDTKPVAIGEIGLDFYRPPENLDQFTQMKLLQEDFFRRQIKLAQALDCPICVHARNAVREAIDIIKDENFNFSKVVFHCFSGTLNELKELNELGGRASFTGIITYKNANDMRTNMLTQGLDKLMLETDCPYLTPTPLRGSTNKPQNIPIIAQSAANTFNVSTQTIANITSNNAINFFNLNK